MNIEEMNELYKEVIKDHYDLEEIKNLNTETLLDEDREIWVKYKWHKQQLTKTQEEAYKKGYADGSISQLTEKGSK